MSCFAPFRVGRTTLLCHRPPGHDGKCEAALDGVAIVHWDHSEVPA